MYRGWTQIDYQNKHYNINQKEEGTQDDRGRDGGTNFILRIREQETRQTIHEYDDDDDDDDDSKQAYVTASSRKVQRRALQCIFTFRFQARIWFAKFDVLTAVNTFRTLDNNGFLFYGEFFGCIYIKMKTVRSFETSVNITQYRTSKSRRDWHLLYFHYQYISGQHQPAVG